MVKMANTMHRKQKAKLKCISNNNTAEKHTGLRYNKNKTLK